MLVSIIAVVITFGIVIFIHEFGHFLMCKLVRIRVYAFSFGFGKELKGVTHGETRYSLRSIPLGGYVKPAGENLNEVTGAPYEYFSKPWYTRLSVVLAGPFMNYLLAFFLFAGVIYVVGEPVPSNEPIIGDLAIGYPADKAGLDIGDRIISVNGKPANSWAEMAKMIHPNVEKEIEIVFERNKVMQTIKIKTKKEPTRRVGIIGISPGMTYKKIGIVKSIQMGVSQCYHWTEYTIKTLAANIREMEKPEIAGPIGIVDIVSRAARAGLIDLIYLIGLISVAVGIFNLLPIPLLDGGHAVLYVIEAIVRKKITAKGMQVVNSIGIAMLAAILIFATYSDIVRLIKPPAGKTAEQSQSQKLNK
jgi:regulator of sigma E protease